jgi:glycine/D-amino acid oxidase-like deaminating enzyme
LKRSLVPPSAPDERAASWWYRDALAPLAPCAPLAGEHAFDVVIVGGGFTGLWTALALRERAPGLSVAVLEAHRCGAGASGKNGGKVSGYWPSLGGLARALGDDDALRVARAGARAQDGIRRWCAAEGRDVWWREAGNLRVSTTVGQDAKIDAIVREAARLGVPETAQPLDEAQVRARCDSPVFRRGLLFPEGANLHPGRLVGALRAAAIERGVAVHEQTPVLGLATGPRSVITTPAARIVAREVVLATNVALAADPLLRAHLCVFSSYAIMTAPAPAALEAQGWHGDEGLTDFRMFLHYFRKTPDGRVLMGSGSGPIASTERVDDPRLRTDAASLARARSGLRRLLPALAEVGIDAGWGGAIDVSSDRLPFFGTFPGTRVHYGCGYSGHGVNATWIGGQCLASLALEARDEWRLSPFCSRALPRLPPEPWRTLGGRAIRWGILACEEAAEAGQDGPWMARALAAAPARLGMRIGTR